MDQCHKQISLPDLTLCPGHQLKWIPLSLLSPHLLDPILPGQLWHKNSGSCADSSQRLKSLKWLLRKMCYNQPLRIQNLRVLCFWVWEWTFPGMRDGVVACCISSTALSVPAGVEGHASQVSRVRFCIPNITCWLGYADPYSLFHKTHCLLL